MQFPSYSVMNDWIDYNCNSKDEYDMSPKKYVFQQLKLDLAENKKDAKKCISQAPEFANEVGLVVN